MKNVDSTTNGHLLEALEMEVNFRMDVEKGENYTKGGDTLIENANNKEEESDKTSAETKLFVKLGVNKNIISKSVEPNNTDNN